MTQTKYNFTVEDGIRTQQQYLAQWKKVLQPWAYARLAAHCDYMNRHLPSHADGFMVFRGQNLDMYLQNEIMRNNNIHK